MFHQIKSLISLLALFTFASIASAETCPQMAIAYDDLASAQSYLGQATLSGGDTDRGYISAAQNYLAAALSEIKAGQAVRGCPGTIGYVDPANTTSACVNRGKALSLIVSGMTRINWAQVNLFGGHGWNALSYSSAAYNYLAADFALFPSCQ